MLYRTIAPEQPLELPIRTQHQTKLTTYSATARPRTTVVVQHFKPSIDLNVGGYQGKRSEHRAKVAKQSPITHKSNIHMRTVQNDSAWAGAMFSITTQHQLMRTTYGSTARPRTTVVITRFWSLYRGLYVPKHLRKRRTRALCSLHGEAKGQSKKQNNRP